MIKHKSLDDMNSDPDEIRILVERCWPQGLDQANLTIDQWCQQLAPSAALCQWYQQQAAHLSIQKQQQQFWQRYRQELIAHPEYWMPLLDMARTSHLSLLYVKMSTLPNHAKMLAEFLEDELDCFNDVSSPVCYAHLSKLD